MNRRKRYPASEWSGLVEQWSQSGDSAERFSARLGVSAETLKRWRKQAAGKASSASLAGVAPTHVDATRSVFTPVQVVRSARAECGLVEVVTQGGCVVRVHGAVNEETLATVLAAVGGC
ncbi:MAG TPA: transposase [Polyangiales bacterium]|nr:transposase [Polyangiales bacterium]